MLHRLFNFLLNYFVFGSTMFFAAGAAVLTGETGGTGGETSGDLGSGNGESSTSGDLPSGDGASDGGTGTGESGADHGTESTGADPNALVDSGDGRKIPQKWAELAKTDKEFRDLYYGQASLRKSYPGGVKEAIQLKKDVEEVGGLEAFESLKGDLDTYHADAEMFERGDPKWVETSFAENADASLKAWTNSLAYVAEKFPEHYDFAIAGAMIDTLDQHSPIHDVYGVLNNPNASPEDRKVAAQKLANFYNGIKNLSKKVPAKPQNQEQDTEKAKLQTEREQIRNQKINLSAQPYLAKAIDGSLDAAAKASGFDLGKIRTDQPKRYERFMADVRRAIHESVLADEPWLDRYTAALAKGDVGKCTRMLNARHDEAIKGNGTKPGVVTPVFHEWFGPAKAGIKPKVDPQKTGTSARGGQQPSGSMLHVNAMPPKNEINWTHDKTKIIDQVAMLKSGKLVTWAK